MKDDRGDLDLTKQIEDLKAQNEELRAELARAKEDHQYDNLVHQKEVETLKNPVKHLRDKGLI
jgi:predicted RNase H-like nuclease (RuvC/YqgF family)|tara:strand:- start:662 stop:850 length:189 start_codon:yes stop_codon:yes gene_type:complete